MTTLLKRRMNQLTEAQRGYLAGIIDGEGCISLEKNWDLRITVVQKGRELPEYLRALTGLGTVNKRNLKDCNLYDWKIFGHGTVELLEELKCLLIVKRDQAILALEYQRERNGSKPLTDEVKERRENYRRRLQNLKK